MTELTGDDYCFACGDKNPIGLRLKFETEDRGVSRTVWTPRKEHQGYADVVHGGLIATVLDEVMVRMLWELGVPAVTAKFEMEIKKPAKPGKPLYVEGRIVGDRGRIISTEAEARDSNEGLVALARATCIVKGKRIKPKPQSTTKAP